MLFLSLACAPPCGPWDELPVTDPDGLLGADELAEMTSAIDTFAEWTGRDETCVSEVEVVDELESGGFEWAGFYLSASRRIEVVADTDRVEVTHHELCHARDHEEGWISVENAEVLAEHAAEVDAERYASEEGRTHEAFARLCEGGPTLPALYDALSDACGVDVGDDAVEWVQRVAFPTAEVPTFGSFSVETARTALYERPGTPMGSTLVPAGAGAVVLDVAYSDTGLLEPMLFRIEDGAVLETLVLDAHPVERDNNGQPLFTEYSLLGSSTDALLVSRVDGQAWRVRADPLSLEEVEFPSFDAMTSLTGFEDGGRAYVLGTLDDAPALGIVDLGDGTFTPVGDTETELFAGDRPVELYADTEGAVVIFGSGGVLAALDWDGGLVWRTALPGGEDRARALTRLEDGTVYVAPSVYLPIDESSSAGVPLPLVLDPTVGDWSVPDGACDDTWAYAPWTAADVGTTTIETEATDDGYLIWLGELSVE